MTEPNNIALPPQVADDYAAFAERARLRNFTILSPPPADDAPAFSFYAEYARLVADSSEFKVLYQVLLDEARCVGAFDEADETFVRDAALADIERLLRAGAWRDARNLESRAGFRHRMLAVLRERIHLRATERDKSGGRIAALCFSGGGIRSATFGLGVIQALAARGLLEQFEYLSTVSGGGYIGGWLSAWIHRLTPGADGADAPKPASTEGAAEVQRRLAASSAAEPEPAEVTHLRSYSNYMSPRTGFLSTDTWTLGAVYLRNLLLNWTVFVPLIAAFLLVPKVLATLVAASGGDVTYAGIWFWIAVAAALVAVVNVNAMRPSLAAFSWVDQRYRSTEIGLYQSVESKVVRYVFVWIVAFAFALVVYRGWSDPENHFPWSSGLAARLFGTATLWDCATLGEIVFVGGYALAWAAMGWRRVLLRFEADRGGNGATPPPPPLATAAANYVWEPPVSIVCGFAGGAMLYGGMLAFDAMRARLAGFATEAELLAALGVPFVLLVFLLGATLFVGLAVRFMDDEDREWMARLGAIVLIAIVGWTVVSAAVLFGPSLLRGLWSTSVLASVGGISGLLTLVGGYSARSIGTADPTSGPRRKSPLATLLPAVAAPVFIVFLAIIISLATGALIDAAGLFGEWRHLAWMLIFAATGAVMGAFININKFSFHAIYRERLIRAYLGASRTKERLFTANSFTGLDTENDNVEMWRLVQRPLHVVNMTLNLVKTHNLRWQNRKAESFTASALFCGSSNMGDGSGNYRDSRGYGRNPRQTRAITLGTAAAISGAAASPNMGYYTMSAAVSFLMVLFNVRLGWWLGNPGRRGRDTWNRSAPRWSPRLFLDESIGGTDDSRPYVYLSDGGHFENLGLYEMVLRRCSLIVAVDSGCDEHFGFSDLGNAIHKIRVDMGIPIEFEDGKRPVKGVNCAVARIRYDCVDGRDARIGMLVYVKPTLDGDEPVDLTNYARENPAFPHESTADQMYSEAQFEAYRSLGRHQMTALCSALGDNKTPTLEDFEKSVGEYLKNAG